MNLTEIHKKITVGFLWSLLSKWLNRGLGFISTLCLVRILSPEDFGLVALASMLLGFFVLLSDAGTHKYLIQAPTLSASVINSAWSLNIALKSGCALLFVVISYPASLLLGHPELQWVLVVMCCQPVLAALKSPSLTLYEKALNYPPLVQLSLKVKLAALPITLLLAFSTRSYWALVVGLMVTEVFSLLGSYLIHPYRPRWTTRHWSKQWSFSKWHIIAVSSGYLRSRIDTLLLGRVLPVDTIGFYRVGQEFAWLPFTELIAPASSAFYAGLAKLNHDPEMLRQTMVGYLTATYLLLVPAAIAIFCHSLMFTELLLGQQWLEAAPIIGLLALMMLPMPLNIGLQVLVTALGKIRYLVVIDIVMISVICLLLTWLQWSDRLTLSLYLQLSLAVEFMFMLMLGYGFHWLIALSYKPIVVAILLPLLPALTMAWLTHHLEVRLNLPLWLDVLLIVPVGVFSYALLLLVAIVLANKQVQQYQFITNRLKRHLFFVKNES